ncbi:hypothetical protein HHI36_017712 [Cryptolaemus montrouzieri]|uniref:Uncharacterized protein n=1 Tax=Cryptolaemus montrouzieri TaxID=559131 RepID=A0ABD2NP56_9CUCU
MSCRHKMKVETAKLRHYRDKIASNLSNPKEILRIINESTGTKSNSPTGKTPKLILHERKITAGNEVADEFNSFFANTGKKLAEKIKPSKDSSRSGSRVLNTFVLRHTIPIEVLRTIKALKHSKSCGVD